MNEIVYVNEDGVNRKATVEEIVQIKKDEAEWEQRQAEQVVKAEQKAAILERLGLTEDELRVVLS
jgi:hypothetical protein